MPCYRELASGPTFEGGRGSGGPRRLRYADCRDVAWRGFFGTWNGRRYPILRRGIGEQQEEVTRRVLVISPQPFYEDRGTPMAIRELVSAFGRLGYGVDVVTFPVGRDVEIPGVRVTRTANPFFIRHVPIGLSFRKVLLDVLLAFTAFRLLLRNRYFSIHGVEEGGFLALLLGRCFGLPVVYEMQSSLPEQLSLRRFFRARPVLAILRACERWLLRRVDMVACSAGLADHVRTVAPGVAVQEWRYPIRSESLTACDKDCLRAELRIDRDSWIITYSGTFEPYQGLMDVVAAIPLASRRIPHLILVLVGASTRSGADLLRVATSLGVADRVRVVPRCPVEEVTRYHALANVLLAPRAAGSNLPLKVFHYMGAGRPILATGAKRDHSILGQGRALVVEHTSWAIANGLVRIHDEPVMAAGFAQEARSYADLMLGDVQFEDAVQSICEQVVALEPVASPAAASM